MFTSRPAWTTPVQSTRLSVIVNGSRISFPIFQLSSGTMDSQPDKRSYLACLSLAVWCWRCKAWNRGPFDRRDTWGSPNHSGLPATTARRIVRIYDVRVRIILLESLEIARIASLVWHVRRIRAIEVIYGTREMFISTELQYEIY